MENPSPTFSSEIVQVVSSFVGVRPAPPSCAESAIVKHPACAAANSSSGFVPTPFSNRVLNEYCEFFSVPLSVDIEPLPPFRSPCQTAEALRCMFESPFCLLGASRHAGWIRSLGRGLYVDDRTTRDVTTGGTRRTRRQGKTRRIIPLEGCSPRHCTQWLVPELQEIRTQRAIKTFENGQRM